MHRSFSPFECNVFRNHRHEQKTVCDYFLLQRTSQVKSLEVRINLEIRIRSDALAGWSPTLYEADNDSEQ